MKEEKTSQEETLGHNLGKKSVFYRYDFSCVSRVGRGGLDFA